MNAIKNSNDLDLSASDGILDSDSFILNATAPVWRNSEGRIVSIRTLNNAYLLGVAQYLFLSAPDYLTALVEDACFQGASEDEARQLVDLGREDILFKTEPAWAIIIGEIEKRGLSFNFQEEFKENRHFAEISELLTLLGPYATYCTPKALSTILRRRASTVLSGGPLMPASWIDFQRSTNGAKIGNYEIYGVDHIAWDEANTQEIKGSTVFARSKGMVHVIDAQGICYVLPQKLYEHEKLTESPYIAANFVAYLQDILTRLLSAFLAKSKKSGSVSI